MRSSATGLNASQPTLKPGQNGTLQAAGAATMKLPPQSVLNASSKKMSSVMTLKPHQAVSLADVVTVWDPAKPLGAHGEKMAVLPKGVDRMASAFKDATKTKEGKRQMMDDLHETAMQRVEQTRQEMEELLTILGAELKVFYAEFEEKLKVTLEELREEEEVRIAAINARFQILEEREQTLRVAVDLERQTRVEHTEAILGPARRSIELLVVDLDKERRIRHTRHDELKQRLEDAATMLSESMDTEQKARETRHEQVVKELELDVARLKKRSVVIEACNAERVAALQDDIINEEKLRKETQDGVVHKLTAFIQKFQAHIREEGQMGC